VTLLNLQEEFFANTQGYLYYFEAVIASIAGKPIYPEPPKPIALDRPIPHNPPQEHVPPWLSKDQQVLHLARAVAANGGPPTPTLKQQALDKATAEKRARQAAQRAKSDEGHRRAKARSDPDLR
jgi:hypothetical protein